MKRTKNNNRRLTPLLMAAVPVALLVPSPAFALRVASITWDASGNSPSAPVDGSGLWDTTTDANWSNFTTDIVWPTSGNEVAAFGGASGTAGVVTLNSPISALGLTFNNPNAGFYTINSNAPGNILTLSGGIIDVNTNAFPTVNANIAGSNGLDLVGSGFLTLGGDNTYTGGTTLTDGILAINSDAAVNNGTGGITFSGGDLEFNNYTSNLSFADAGGFAFLGAEVGAPSTLAGNITGNTFPTFFGPGTLHLSGVNTYTGSTYVDGGEVIIDNPGALPAGTGIFLYVGATLGIGADSEINNSGGVTFVSGGTLEFENYASALAFNNVPNLGLGAALGAGSSLSGNITGTSSLTYAGPGSLTLTGSNTYSGGTIVSGGTLIFATPGALPATGTLAIGAPGLLAAVKFANGAGANTQTMVTVSTGSTLDLGNNKLVIAYGSPANDPVAAILADLVSGRNGGAWNGTGIDSSAIANSHFAIGYADADSGDAAVGLQPNQLIVKYTLAGDATLANSVGIGDLLIVAQNFGKTGKDWAHGNFTYDPSGSVGIADLLLVAQNFSKTSGVSEGTPAVTRSSAWETATSQVPEPASVMLLAVGAIGLLSRRRNRSA